MVTPSGPGSAPPGRVPHPCTAEPALGKRGDVTADPYPDEPAYAARAPEPRYREVLPTAEQCWREFWQVVTDALAGASSPAEVQAAKDRRPA